MTKSKTDFAKEIKGFKKKISFLKKIQITLPTRFVRLSQGTE